MTKYDENQIPSIWRLQPTPKVALTPDLIRSRAARLDAQVRNQNRTDILSLVGLVICAVVAALVAPGLLMRAGLLLLAAWAAVGAYLTRWFRSPDPLPDQPIACANWYVSHLERQRDYMLSAPWGMGLALPGLALLLIGYSTPPGHVPWQQSMTLGGLIVFVYFAYVIYGKLLAGRWQREIDSLRSQMNGQRVQQ